MLRDTFSSSNCYVFSKKLFVSNKWGTFPESHRKKWWLGSWFASLEPLEIPNYAVAAKVRTDQGLKTIECPIVMEIDGLAMSSRNVYLVNEEKASVGTVSILKDRRTVVPSWRTCAGRF